MTLAIRITSSLEVFCKVCVLKNFTKVIGEHLCGSLILEACNLLDKEASRVTTRSEACQKFGFFIQKSWFFDKIRYLLQKSFEVMLILVYCIKLEENKVSDRTCIRRYSETLSYFNFFIFWSSYCLKHLISRTVEITKFHIQLQYFIKSNLVSVVLFNFYSRLSSSLETVSNIWKSFEMVLYTLVQY